MDITALKVAGAALIEIERLNDERGFFARGFCQREFRDAGLNLDVVQTNLSHNLHKGTLRGLHYQAAPHPDPKLVSCIQGEIFDVVVDLRAGSDTYLQWSGVDLSALNHRAVFVPPGCAHGFITLSDNAVVHYQMGAEFVADLARGVRWDDPAFAIEWPLRPAVMSARDAHYDDFGGLDDRKGGG